MASFGQQPRVLTFDIINQAFNLVMKNWATYVVATLVVGVGSSIAFGVIYVLFMALGIGMAGSAGNADIAGALFGSSMIFMLLGFFALMAAFMPVVFCIPYGVLRELRGETVTMSNIFQLGENWMQLALYFLIMNIAYIIGIYLCVIPGLIVLSITYTGAFLVRDRKMAIGDAIKMSWEATKPQLVTAIGLVFVGSIISQLGFIACCVGMLFTVPVALAMHAFVYRTLLDDQAPQPQAYPGWQ